METTDQQAAPSVFIVESHEVECDIQSNKNSNTIFPVFKKALPQTLFRNKFINNSKSGEKEDHNILDCESANDEIENINQESGTHFEEIEEKEIISEGDNTSLSRKIGGLTKEVIRKSEKAGSYAIGVANGVANGVIKIPVKTVETVEKAANSVRLPSIKSPRLGESADRLPQMRTVENLTLEKSASSSSILEYKRENVKKPRRQKEHTADVKDRDLESLHDSIKTNSEVISNTIEQEINSIRCQNNYLIERLDVVSKQVERSTETVAQLAQQLSNIEESLVAIHERQQEQITLIEVFVAIVNYIVLVCKLIFGLFTSKAPASKKDK